MPVIPHVVRRGARHEMCDNPARKHAHNGMLSPVEFERQFKTQSEGV